MKSLSLRPDQAGKIWGFNFMNKWPNNAKLKQMASGHLCLVFTEPVMWESFPEFACHIAGLVGATIIERADAIDMRIWKLGFQEFYIRIVYEDYPLQVSLESDSDIADTYLRQIADKF